MISMKRLITAIAGVAGVAIAALVPAMASAQTATSGTTFYGTLGYSSTDLDRVDLGAIQGRVGARFGQYFGVEGELSGGVKDGKVNVGGTDVNVKLDSQEAIYGVGFLPITPNFDLLARVGYGHTSGSGSVPGIVSSVEGDSWNFGVGGQYSFDGVNGVRVDYTREAFQRDGAQDANVWSLAYVRKF
jgi:outer membrane immunogenic protein